MDNSSDAVLIKAARLKLFAIWQALAAIFNDCIIKTISSDAESRGARWRQAFVYRKNDGQVTSHFVSICNEKHGK